MSVKPKRKSGGRARAEDRETRERAILDAALDVAGLLDAHLAVLMRALKGRDS